MSSLETIGRDYDTSVDSVESPIEGTETLTANTWLAIALTLVVGVTTFHYATDASAVEFHNVYRRLYYVPIVIAAFSHGLRGGLGIAALCCVAYAPHAFFMEHGSPSPLIDKLLEMVLYLAIGGLTGWLVKRQMEVQQALEQSLEERDALEQSLVRAGKLSALGRLTSGLAHEIRNPLASIMGSAESLADEFDESHRKHRLAEVMITEIDRLNEVVSDFLSFARPTRPERQRIDPVAVAREVLELTRSRPQDVDAQIVFEPAEGAIEVTGDRGQISQVLLNLFLNAYDALEEADVEQPQITVRTRRSEVGGRTYACIGIRDNGPGIDPELREQVFDPYFTTRDEGTGLGLSISSRIVETHGGYIDLESRAGDGTTFWVCLPEEEER